MSSELVKLMQQTINKRYSEGRLKREGKSWILQEIRQDTQEVVREQEIRSPNRNSFAFSLDCPDPKPLAFFSGSPPKGMARMCDAIMVCAYRQRCYLFLIELKTGDEGNYAKQLRNGKIFCDWLLRLYEEHGYHYTPPIFVGLLISFPRGSSKRKGRTAHDSTRNWKREKDVFDYRFDIENRASVPIVELCHLCESGMNSK